MSTTTRGFLIFGVLVLVVAFGCIGPAFFWLPQAGVGVPLPVITLPGEVLAGNVFPGWLGYDLTNTFTSLILVDLILFAIALVVIRATAGVAPDRFVPRGFTNFIELLAEFLYNQARTLLGPHVQKVFPLAATIFLMLLVANWVKLIPGVESVGVLACAEPNQPGFPIMGHDDTTPGIFLKVDSLDLGGRAGTKATIDNTHACEEAHPEFTPPLVEAKRARGEEVEGAGEDHGTTEEGAPAEGGDHSDEATPEETPHASIAPASFVSVNTASKKAAEANPDLFVVIPYFRALATDLNFPIALALIVVIMVQVWGVQVLGPAYFFKFINIPALGNISKKPLGAIDFIVGLVEIISEISRIVSLSFRLFGNIFAGGVLLIVMTFLVALVLPGVFYFLEIFVGAIQAYVFSTLTLIYASQAVTAHHGDDEHHDEHEEHH
ncbi:MAG: F0F1 ATP synthase subunit A [Anaerolineae bacterium]|nr:F0F1 ATP synthase subunit A [Anaerolineae bacterium]